MNSSSHERSKASEEEKNVSETTKKRKKSNNTKGKERKNTKGKERKNTKGKERKNTKGKERSCDNPTSEHDNLKRHFVEVGLDGYYMQQESTTDNNQVCYSTATEKLLNLHLKFIKHRISLDVSKEEQEVHKFIPYNERQDCNCIKKDVGIQHNVFPGFPNYAECNPHTNNPSKLHHYRMVVAPEINFVTHRPTTICYDGKEFSFEGYSIFTHQPIDHIPSYFFLRNSMDHELKFVKEDFIPKGFCVHELDLISDYLFTDMFELLDWNHKDTVEGKCQKFHFMPRFVNTEDSTQNKCSKLLSMVAILRYLMESYTPFLNETKDFNTLQWKKFSREHYGSLIINPQKKPKVLRVDAVVTPQFATKGNSQPVIQHSTSFSTTIKDSTKGVPREKDQELLQDKTEKMKTERVKRNFADVELCCDGYMSTGLRWDICQHASYLPSVWRYLSFMLCLPSLEEKLNYSFKDISLLKTALTHPSYSDQSSLTAHTRTMLQNIGKRNPHVAHGSRPASLGYRKKGVINLTTIMANVFHSPEQNVWYQNNERLEFLGDAVLDYITSLHLFLMFPEKGPGKLTPFRSALVQKDNLVRISKNLELEKYILIHHNMNESHIMVNFLANAVEAIIGAVYLDGGLNATDEFVSGLLFPDDDELAVVWKNLQTHPLQNHLPSGDRHLIKTSTTLQKLTKLEERIGIQFKHIRILAKALTQSVAGLDDSTLTGGNYERLEFLGDAILKYVCTDHLYRRFQAHQEGPLTLLRTTFVNTECLSKAAKEIDLNEYIIYKSERDAAMMSEKVICDVFEAFVGAIHIDKGIKHCKKFTEVCLLSRLEEFVMNQEWIDPKTQLQQCCHSLKTTRDRAGSSSHLLVYKKLQHTTERGTQFFEVAVYFQDQRLGTGTGSSLKSAEKEAARDALRNNHFEQHARQKRIAYQMFGPKRTENHGFNAKDRIDRHVHKRHGASKESRQIHYSSGKTHKDLRYSLESSRRKRKTSTSSNTSSPKQRRNRDFRHPSHSRDVTSARKSTTHTKYEGRKGESLSPSDNKVGISFDSVNMSISDDEDEQNN